MAKPIKVMSGPEEGGDCGVLCWKVFTDYESTQPPEWYVVPTGSVSGFDYALGNPPDGIKYLIGTSEPIGPTNGNGNAFTFDICLNPDDHPPGDYYVGAFRWQPKLIGSGGNQRWIWSEQTITYDPQVATTLTTALDGNSNYNLGTVPCDSPLVLTALREQCLIKYRVRVRRTHQGAEVGPETWLSGPNWQPAPLPTIDLRQLAAIAGFDFVPGQCYKVDVFSKYLMNGTQWKSTGHVFCIDC